uniref:Transmembrane protein n=1 Tax=Peronospora matthiolae TaxID=2874970 RepID=A0AAV1VGX3_9STRA
MVLTQPFLPTCEELDLLDAHLHELEEPGTTFLQDFIVAPPLMPSDTPLSTSSGYTSEESDHSIMTGSDEFLQCRGMSFLQAAKTSELVDVVEDLSAQDLMAVSPRSQQHYQHFTGMGVKSKTSKYRGVTQTSKTSWGAKYSAKRITNTCKTPEEAARAYDKYLETNFPQKFAKFANFCHKCDKFVNPLGLPQYQSECVCSSSSPIGSPLSEAASMSLKKEIDTEQQVTSPTATLPLVPPMAPSPAGVPSTLNMMDVLNHRSDVDPANEQSTTFVGRCSNNMSGSLKFSFSDGAERPFAQSYDSGTKILQNQDGAALTEVQQQGQDKMYDSLPMTAISSAVDSFTLGDNLDQIIKDINHPPSFQSLLNRSVAEERVANDNARICPTAIRSSSGIGKMSESATYDTILVEPATPNSLGFDVDELDELTNYFLSENDVTVAVQREMHADPISTEQHPVVKEERSRQFKKIHSLDFDCENTTDSDAAMNDVKLEDAGGTFLAIPVGVNSSGSTPPGSSSSATIDIQTQFLEKYWRNDRKNIQCFPYCPEHGDYYRVRIEDLQHQCKGVCHAPVKARVSIPAPAGASVVKTGLTVLARCNSSFSQQKALTEQQLLSSAEMKSLQGVSTIGVISQFTPVRNGTGGVQFDVMFHPDVWKFEFALPKKRRHIQSSNRALSSDDSVASGGSTAAEFLYFFEIDVFYSRGRTSFERLGHTKSANFRIGNTRTLLRQRNKRVGEMCCSEEPQTYVGGCDNDKMISVDDLPEKKKVKVHLGQRELLSGASFSDDSARSGCELAESKLLSDCATGEDISSSSKLSLPTVKPTCMDGDRCIKTDSKDSTCDRKPGLLDLPHADSDVWKNMNASSVGTQQTAASDYRSYVSPKQKHGSVQMADSLVATSTSFTRSTNERPAASTSSAVTESYSLPELLRYSLACAPLSLLFMPVGILLTLVFVIVPLAASNVVGALDSLSDMELSRANRSCISRDRRLVLSRLVEEKGDSDKKPSGGGLFHYHVNGKVWYRLFYFSGAKFVVSMISLVPALLLALFAGLLYPIRSVSGVIGNAASSCALWSREYTRTTTGMPLSGDIVDYDATDGRV